MLMMSAVKITCQLIAETENLLGHFDQSQTRTKFECIHWMKKGICPKFARCKSVANMKFAKLCIECKVGDGRIRTKTSKFGHCHVCTKCKVLQSSYLQHICMRQILCKFVFLSCECWLSVNFTTTFFTLDKFQYKLPLLRHTHSFFV